MVYRIKDRVQQTTTSTGTGALLLDGTVPRMFTFAGSGYQDGDTFPGLIEHDDADEVEIAECTFHTGSPNYITRAAVPKRSTTSSTIDFSAGTKKISVVAWANEWEVKSADFDVEARGRYRVDTSDAAVTATIPDTLADGDEIEFSDYAGTWATANLVIDGNGYLFEDGGARLICDTPAHFTIIVADGVLTLR